MIKPVELPDCFIRARRHLLLDHVFFGSLIMYLEPRVDTTQPTLWVDGKTLGFNPDYLASLSLEEAAGVLAHETFHCAAEHHLRRDNRDPDGWNEAADYVTNPIIRNSGLPLPQGTLFDPDYSGKSAEEVYALRQRTKQQQDPNSGQGQGQGQGSQPQPQNDAGHSPPKPGRGKGASATGEVRDMPATSGEPIPSPAEKTSDAEQWKTRMQQAINNAKGQGCLPAGLEREVRELLKPKKDWREETCRFFQSINRAESSWSIPNRRFIGSGLYLPGMRIATAGVFIVAIDTSGSIGARLLEQFGGHLSNIIEDVKPERVYVPYCDAAVAHVDEFTAEDTPLQLHPHGGGGTDFRPVFDWVEEMGLQPDCLIYLTDMMGTFPNVTPPYPVLWASTSSREQAPFGEVIHIQETYQP